MSAQTKGRGAEAPQGYPAGGLDRAFPGMRRVPGMCRRVVVVDVGEAGGLSRLSFLEELAKVRSRFDS